MTSYVDILKKNMPKSAIDAIDAIDTQESYTIDNIVIKKRNTTKFDNESYSSETASEGKSEGKSKNTNNLSFKLPGGRKYQKEGIRLENAFYSNIPKNIKHYIERNKAPKNEKGNVITEFDMLYISNSSKRIISFEIKGVNYKTINNYERQQKLIYQGKRQLKYLTENYSDYKINIIYCFIIGKKKETVDELNQSIWGKPKHKICSNFINTIKENGFLVSIGKTPSECCRIAIKMLNLLK